tara:strand:+ start:15272 stop:15859 length:588 start_codon:yes stop_codon:yes gene_type:complete
MKDGVRYMGANDFDATGVSQPNQQAYDRLAGVAGEQTITSGYRSPEKNAAVGGAQHSQHMGGNALDLSTDGMSQTQIEILIGQGRAAGYGGVGVYDGSVHFDTGPERAWGSDYTNASLPDWAGGILGNSEKTQHDQLADNREEGPVEPEKTKGQKIAGAIATALQPVDTGPSLNSQRKLTPVESVGMIPNQGIPT